MDNFQDLLMGQDRTGGSHILNVGTHYELWKTEVQGRVVLCRIYKRHRDITWQQWTYQVGLKGENMNVNALEGTSTVEWMGGSLAVQTQQWLTSYMAYFDAPAGDEPLALDMGSMGKGQVWINGQSIGRYWKAYAPNGNCNQYSYIGTYHSPKCQTGCGEPTQRWYHVPRSSLNPTKNLLVVFEELGGDTTKISLVKRGGAQAKGTPPMCTGTYHINHQIFKLRHSLRNMWQLRGGSFPLSKVYYAILEKVLSNTRVPSRLCNVPNIVLRLCNYRSHWKGMC